MFFSSNQFEDDRGLHFLLQFNEKKAKKRRQREALARGEKLPEDDDEKEVLLDTPIDECPSLPITRTEYSVNCVVDHEHLASIQEMVEAVVYPELWSSSIGSEQFCLDLKVYGGFLRLHTRSLS